ncbi:glycosyltransferase family 4 protein [Oleiagrimonas sp. C23AA]|uniref:MraY family glycosyltransferase n=1 Tax=Oleiagrimonas sp. C23AA TaxID=2719047 RepID=UPI0014209C1C|nr:glycosyltransferase family 4 protein [Oleiagrimonas sp. C23AA]NII10442.1 glycosyltransferase family 4 protein [Oleiagrimonas sp. C23AA]
MSAPWGSELTRLSVLLVLAWGASAAGVRLMIGYTLRRGMLDLPGQRRSHTVPTPRGGGLGMVAAMLLAGGVAASWPGSAMPISLWTGALLAIVLVAGVGWGDDQVSLPVLPRLAVQLLASALFAYVLCQWGGIALWWCLPLCMAGTASVNLHNFMDGIDGLLGMQAVFIGVVMVAMGYVADVAPLTCMAIIMAGAAMGFLHYNRPPARIFMGDAGSGSLGLLVFMLVALVWAIRTEYVWSALIACSGFLIDAGLTLAWRMARGRRWYSAHREHLYQWLVRRGWSHARTGCLYMIWNLISIPVVLFAWHAPQHGLTLALCWYALGAALWWIGRMRCLKLARAGR